MSKVKAWKHGAPGEPSFPEDFEILNRAVLQVTEIKTNHNKYYGIELHMAKNGAGLQFRVFTHYGRTDDLETNPNAGQKECRYFDDLGQAKSNYDSIFNEKTSPRKGYRELSLASTRIGSQKAQGTSSGTMDAKTIQKLAEAEKGEKPVKKPAVVLAPEVADLVRYIYAEATNALTATVAAKITARGIETPLGILTIGQIEKGEAFLQDIYRTIKAGGAPARLESLSNEFYTVVPHRIGRSRAAVEEAVIRTWEDFEQKTETLQLMKDMLQVNGEAGSVLFDEEVGAQFAALNCKLAALAPSSAAYAELRKFVEGSQIKSKSIKVRNVWTLQRDGEPSRYRESVGNERLLFHGSRIKNWVGLLSRGILMPKVAVSMGVNRTDEGWLGNGIYFGDAACTSAFYTSPGKKGTRLMAVARVALGRIKDYHKITYGLTTPPPGFDSCHGVRRQKGVDSQFDDDEFVIYDIAQQKLEYLVEFTA